MKTAHVATAARPAITSTVGALSDRELLRETSNLVRHERHLQGAIIDHLAEIEARGLYLERGFSSLFDYAVRELGYSDAAAARRIGVMRLCADQPHARGGVARRLADAERRRGAAVGVRPAAAPRVDLPRRGDRTGGVGGGVSGTERSGGRLRAGRTVALRRAGALAAAGAGCGRAAEAAGGGGRQERPAGPPDAGRPGPGAGAAADRVRPLGDGRYELKAVIDAECQQGLEQLRGLLSHVDPRMTIGLLVGRLVKEGLDRHDPSRPPRRARSGSRPADAKATAPRTPTSEQAQRNSAPAAKHAARPAIPAGAATTPARAVRPMPTSAPPPSTQEETARRAATGAKPTSAATPASNSYASGRAISAAVRRHVWQRDGGRLQLRRSTDRAPLQLNASDRDRPHRPACAGARRRSSQPQTSVWRAHHRHRHAQGRSSREPAPRDLAP